jgi:hypothetical protein
MSEDFLSWQDAINENNGTGNIDKFNIETRAQYFRFTGLQRATQGAHSFCEFEVFGKLHDFTNSIYWAENSFLENIQISPNPALNHIDLVIPDQNLNVDLKIFNLTGGLVHEGVVNSHQ